ncbi:uncharacterized protein LOC108098710 [Drosophila ficusphila]|uniref:uncharacterized protein LOC108098710 n=1 Tax=Drosophila ficusphila TaxID=30025 RepID=UPI0007E86A17|nr:uncharacterized protein LOC108098710 [Drosophila ficusphila]
MAFFLIRLAIVAGVVYGTQELGFWDSAGHSQDLLDEVKREVKPVSENMMNRFCCWRCENCDRDKGVKPWQESMVDAWNESVKKTFTTLGVHVPFYYNRFREDFQKGIDDFMNGSED